MKISVFDEFRGEGAFEKANRGLNEPKVTLFTIGTEFLATNERNLMFDKKSIKKYELGVPLKRSKRVLVRQKSYFWS